MTSRGAQFFIVAVCLALSACAGSRLAQVAPDERAALEQRLMRDIEILASDEFGGRKPGTDGEVRTVDFLIAEMQGAGFVSGTNDPGSAWRAPVELISSTSRPGTITLRDGRRTVEPDEKAGAVVTSGSRTLIDNGDMVFVGYEAGSIVPEDIAGNVVVMLGEPGVSPARRAKLFESAPSAIMTVVDDADDIAAVTQIYGRERVLLASEGESRLTAYVTHAIMAQLVGEERWQALLGAAEDENFVPIQLGATASFDASSTRREFTSSNVLGLLPGTSRGSGTVVLMAHWDHLGECASDAPDLICNGAVDNASGVAVMLELARRLAAADPHDRDILLFATTAEEQGLLGARAFVAEPPVPLEDIVAVFNFDTVAVAPAGSALGFIGEGRTPLDDIVRQTAAEAGRELGNREFAESFVRRQDGWALLEEGVPAVMLTSAFASEIVIGPYLAEDYHSPSDETARIELGGAIDDLLLHEVLIRRVADTATYVPQSER
ncbi:MAG: M28 family peptidase [Erythrobacter sp.]